MTLKFYDIETGTVTETETETGKNILRLVKTNIAWNDKDKIIDYAQARALVRTYAGGIAKML